MATKTFNIGECAVGGSIKIDVAGNNITVTCLQYKTTKEVVAPKVFDASADEAERRLEWYLDDMSTSYYAGKMVDWVKTKVKFFSESMW